MEEDFWAFSEWDKLEMSQVDQHQYELLKNFWEYMKIQDKQIHTMQEEIEHLIDGLSHLTEAVERLIPHG